ncbi:MarR family winged helix-turn-helix transcriptional regulator [Massilia sp. IC2-477]|uniref:MarR family winged helix-turn-helix transcriptional regulator n=1 Tax=unclassified Massilia TaxID=2609279 RepID=UPI001D1300BF|nr:MULTISPECIES: MarR family winged helix-turn-helix transcriptional regulator [unclassified Massilia]MCC2957645.1 MarR family winged helix-turn-helix transcriptional regulator [Massilia sp. IC2-477]MCC2973664.1 MarR family winged helix-turn-helix transcriptional regulator [Massilia sp. IC2-476]
MDLDQPLPDTACYCSSLRQASRYVTSFYDQMLSGSGLRVTQFAILSRLRARAATVTQLAQSMVMDRTTLARNLQPLVREQLVQITPSEQDRRERVIALTDAGREKVEAILPAWRRAQARFDQQFGAQQSAQLLATMRAVVDSGLHATGDAPANSDAHGAD